MIIKSSVSYKYTLSSLQLTLSVLHFSACPASVAGMAPRPQQRYDFEDLASGTPYEDEIEVQYFGKS